MPSGGYRPGAGRPRKNPIDKKLEGKSTVGKATPKPTVKKEWLIYWAFYTSTLLPLLSILSTQRAS